MDITHFNFPVVKTVFSVHEVPYFRRHRKYSLKGETIGNLDSYVCFCCTSITLTSLEYDYKSSGMHFISLLQVNVVSFLVILKVQIAY